MNQCVFTGRLVRDPELRFIAGSGTAVTNMTIAVEKDLSKDQKEDFKSRGKATADFPRLVFWGKQAEVVCNYFHKGDGIVIKNAKFESTTFIREDGSTGYGSQFNVREWEFPMGKAQQTQQSDDFSMGGVDTSDFRAIEDDDDIPF